MGTEATTKHSAALRCVMHLVTEAIVVICSDVEGETFFFIIKSPQNSAKFYGRYFVF